MADRTVAWEPEVVLPSLTTVVAHQGGWDEALFVAVPMAILVVLLRLAQRRAEAEQEAEGRGPTDGRGADDA